METYDLPSLRLTHAAQTHAAARDGAQALERVATAEMEELSESRSRDLGGIIFHAFSYHGFYNMIMFPSSEESGVMIVDCAEDEERPSIKRPDGLFSGLKVIVPRPVSEGEE